MLHHKKVVYSRYEPYCWVFAQFTCFGKWWGPVFFLDSREIVWGEGFLDFYRSYDLEELAGYLRCEFSWPNKATIDFINPNGRTCARNIPKTDRLRMGLNNILTILHNNHAVQHTQIIFQNNLRFILLRWWKCYSFTHY